MKQPEQMRIIQNLKEPSELKQQRLQSAIKKHDELVQKVQFSKNNYLVDNSSFNVMPSLFFYKLFAKK